MTTPNVLDEETSFAATSDNPFAGIGLDSVEEDANYLADGKYRCNLFDVKINRVKKDGATKGMPMLVVTWKVAPEQKYSGVRRDEMYVINKDDAPGLGRLKKSLKRIGLPESAMAKLDLNDIKTFVGDEYFVTFKKNGDYININAVEPVNSSTLSVANGGQPQVAKVDLTADL